eukprot:Gb_19998 [translate_table: standard]
MLSVFLFLNSNTWEISEFLQQKEVEAVVDCLLVQDGVDIPAGLLKTSRRIVHVTPLVMQKMAGVESINATEAIGVIKLPKSFCNMESVGIQSLSFQKWCSLPHRLLVLDGIQVLAKGLPVGSQRPVTLYVKGASKKLLIQHKYVTMRVSPKEHSSFLLVPFSILFSEHVELYLVVAFHPHKVWSTWCLHPNPPSRVSALLCFLHICK